MNCRIDAAKETLDIQDRSVKLDSSLAYIGCSRIIACEMIQILPRSEKIIKGKMVESTLKNDRLCMTEP